MIRAAYFFFLHRNVLFSFSMQGEFCYCIVIGDLYNSNFTLDSESLILIVINNGHFYSAAIKAASHCELFLRGLYFLLDCY